MRKEVMVHSSYQCWRRQVQGPVQGTDAGTIATACALGSAEKGGAVAAVAARAFWSLVHAAWYHIFLHTATVKKWFIIYIFYLFC
jgi:hypothetical protein